MVLRPCMVCGEPAKNYNFGVFTCKACAAFFRRSYHRQYRCSKRSRCDIRQAGMRNVCRACRMQKCIDVGMRRQDVDTETFDSAFKAEYYLPSVQPNPQTYLPMTNFRTRHAAISELLFSNRIDEATVMSLMTKASMNVAPANRFSAVSATDFPQLAKIVGEFRRLHANQRNIYLTSNPDDIYSEAPLRAIWKAEYIRMEDETLPLVAEFIRNVIPQYEHLPDDKKLSTLKTFTPELLFYHKVFMTVTTFPSDADTRIATHYGYYADLDNLYSFFEGLQLPERRIKIVTPTAMAWLDTAKKFRGLHIREVEVAALATALLWEEVAKQNLLDAEMSAMRDACYEEFHANVIKEYGPVEGGIRIVKLLCLQKDITILTSLYAELFLMSSIFGPDNVGTEATT